MLHASGRGTVFKELHPNAVVSNHTATLREYQQIWKAPRRCPMVRSHHMSRSSHSYPKDLISIVQLGNSGFKVSRIILGTGSYGDPRWAKWVLPEEEAIKHIKFAYVFLNQARSRCSLSRPYSYEHGITTFDTANARTPICLY